MILHSASCRCCEGVTGRAEQVCLKGILGKFRVKAGLPTRNPKERPTRLELAVYETSDDPHPAKRLVPIDEYPFSLALLRCSKYPGAMLGEPPSDQLHIEGM